MTIFPGLNYFHLTFTISLLIVYVCTNLLFSALSYLCLFKSSNKSLIKETVTIKVNGIYIVGYPFVDDISLIIYSNPISYIWRTNK